MPAEHVQDFYRCEQPTPEQEADTIRDAHEYLERVLPEGLQFTLLVDMPDGIIIVGNAGVASVHNFAQVLVTELEFRVKEIDDVP